MMESNDESLRINRGNEGRRRRTTNFPMNFHITSLSLLLCFFVHNASFVTANENQWVTLKCPVSLPGSLTDVYWLKDGQRVDTSDTSKYSGGTTANPDLSILMTSLEDNGGYVCVARTSGGTSTSGNTNVDFIHKPRITVSTRPIMTSPGSTIILTCLIDANPAITKLFWIKNKQQIINPSDVTKYGGGTISAPTLSIYNAADTDSGEYSCTATNSIGTTTSDSVVVIVLSVTVQPVIAPVDPVTYGVENQPVTLLCQLVCVLSLTSLTELYWLKDGKRLVTTDSSKYSGGTVNIPNLTIQSVSTKDTGRYVCVASNDKGTASGGKTALQIAYQPQISVPTTPIIAKPGTMIPLTCSVNANPAITNLYWTKIGQQVTNTCANVAKYRGGTTCDPTLRILNAAYTDSGEYTCIATNPIGTTAAGPCLIIVTDCEPFQFGFGCENCVCNRINTLYCNPTDGTCVCKTGWTGQNCSVDVNECNKDGVCPDHSTCINEEGSYTCVCNLGYFRIETTNTLTCQECEPHKYGYNCSQSCMCNWTNTDYCNATDGRCVCKSGWTGQNCSVDENECVEDGVCPDHSTCINVEGSYYCVCDPGYIGLEAAKTLTCKECEAFKFGTNCSQNCVCNRINTDYCNATDGTCVCKSGWTGQRCPLDVDECDKDEVCPDHSTCINTAGSYYCACDPGYSWIGATKTCEECEAFKFGINCSQNCECIKPNTLYCNAIYGTCECKTGWTGPNCPVDVNECDYNGLCPDHSTCINTAGSYYCDCDRGYRWIDTTKTCQECESFKFGYNCSRSCECNRNHTNSCDATDGKCLCKSGWRGQDCYYDVNECEEDGVCPDHSTCINTAGSYYCVCDLGFSWIDATKTCQECEPFKFGYNCSQSCDCIKNNTNSCKATDGTCVCKNGWRGRNCSIDIDECVYYGVCPHHSTCANEEGSYTCVCDAGYIRIETTNTLTCQECGPFLFGTDCSQNCDCIEPNTDHCNATDGTCVCKSGWTGQRCPLDVNECDEGGVCPDHSTCINTEGSYYCACDRGYNWTEATKTCKECEAFKFGINCSQNCECIKPNTLYCNATYGTCVCKSGWTGQNCSLDVNECDEDGVCPDHSTCINTAGSYNCDCDPGYSWIETTKTCKECEASKFGYNCSYSCECNRIHTNSCDATDGRCLCKSGWTGQNCTQDVNECDEGCLCPFHSTCFNSEGSYTCVCDLGYSRIETTNALTCQECAPFKYGYNCSQNCGCNRINTDHCDATDGTCVCKSGWTGPDCFYDVDECYKEGACPDHSTCFNTAGSYYCVCDRGYSRLETTNTLTCQECEPFKFGFNCSQDCDCCMPNTLSCNATYGLCVCKSGWTGWNCSEDVDECCCNRRVCPDHTTCINTEGSYTCVCDPGYSWIDATKTCQECEPFKFGYNCSQSCECNSINTDYCNPTDGTCVCKSGWRGQNCSQDLNECDFYGVCSDHSTCINEQGSYTCVCDLGYSWIEANKTCKECDAFKFGYNCSQNCVCNRTCTSHCNATDGTCVCKSGWTGQDCSVDVNECDEDGVCPDHSTCINEKGSYTCLCDPGNRWIEATKTCQECEPFKFGYNCGFSCECNRINTDYCDAADGKCVCKSGWRGQNCSQELK